MCLDQVQTQVAALKAKWLKDVKEPKALFTSEEYKTLQSKKLAMEKDQLSRETDLQRYFDNATQGSSVLSSSLNKTDKVELTLTTDLESRKAGFRQMWLSRIEFRNFLAPTSFELAAVYYQPEAEVSESEIRI